MTKPTLKYIPSYTSKLVDWDSWACVRTRPRRMLHVKSGEASYFSKALVPVVGHPKIVDRGIEYEMLLQHLYGYLNFTAVLEHRFVNHVTHRIACGEYAYDATGAMKTDAYRIYCDEAYHALASADIIEQVELQSKIPAVALGKPRFLVAVEQAIRDAPKQTQEAIQIMFVVVTETLISATLSDVQSDRTVVAAVREIINDHATDEAVHHIYFSEFLRRIWDQLDPQAKQYIVPLLPGFINGFLRPDLERTVEVLRSYGFERRDVDGIIGESYREDKLMKAVRSNSQATRRLFKSVGVLDSGLAMDSFGKAGLL